MYIQCTDSWETIIDAMEQGKNIVSDNKLFFVLLRLYYQASGYYPHRDITQLRFSHHLLHFKTQKSHRYVDIAASYRAIYFICYDLLYVFQEKKSIQLK